MRKLFSIFAALTLSVGLWAQGSVITYRAESKLEPGSGGEFNFGELSFTHEFNDGVGTFTFDGELTSIPDMAFTGCMGLISIELPESVTEIGGFLMCMNLQDVTAANVRTIRDNAFNGCQSLEEFDFSNVTTIKGGAFAGTNLQSVDLPNVGEIGFDAFSNCQNLQSVFMPNVTTIENYTFANCGNLQSIDLSNVTMIGNNAFQWCGLQSVTVPATLTEIGENAFVDCQQLQSVTFLGNSCNIIENAFSGVGNGTPATLILPDNWTGSKPDAEGNWYGGHFAVPAKVGDQFIDADSGLKFEITSLDPNEVKVIQLGDEGPNYEGTSYTVPATVSYSSGSYTVTEIGMNAFSSCSQLESITIPASVESIGGWAFVLCTALTSVTVSWTSNIPTPGESAFDAIASPAILHVPAGTKALYEAAGWDTWFTIEDPAAPQTSTTVSDLVGLQAALSTEVDTVFVSQTIFLTNGITIDAKGKVISVLKPYMAETGMIAEESSDYSVFYVEDTVSIANATILGGSEGGVYVTPKALLTMENVTIARSYRGLNVMNGTVIMKNCDIVRNVCYNGGGILLANGSKLIMDGCSLSENRSLADGGGGGAMEIQEGAFFYANNTVIANNSSSEIGGAINLYSGTAYLINCTVSGNTNQTWYGAKAGAGIGNNDGTLYAANCIFMNNTFFDPDTEEPTISDIGLFSGNNLTMINCIYGGVAGGTPAVVTNCKVATKSDAVFAGYRQDGVFRLTNAQTPGFKHSILTRKEGGSFFSLYAPAGQFSGEGGIATYMDYSDINNIKMAYDNGGITSLGGLSVEDLTEDNKVTTYYESGTRTAGVVGASAVDLRTYYTVKLIINKYVSVKGVTIYGESYPEGTTVPISHTTDDGFYFHGWNLDMAGTPVFENDNPYNLVVHSDVNVYPQVATDGAYSIFVNLSDKDYVFDVTSGSAQPINEEGYEQGTNVSIEAIRQWYIVEKWTDFDGNQLSTDNPLDLTMDGDKYLIPVWKLDPNVAQVTVLDAEYGSVSGLAKDGKYYKESTVTLTANAQIGYEFKEWQDGNGNKISTTNPLSFTITQDTTLKPVYQAEQRSYEIATGVTAQMGTINKSLPWTKTAAKPGLAYMSTNKDSDGTESRDTLFIIPEADKYYRLTFDYAVSSEGGYDLMSVWVNGVVIANAISGEDSGSYDSQAAFLIEPGQTATIVMSYAKDGSGGYDDDRGYIYNIQVISYDTPPTIYTVSVLNGEGGSVTGLAPEGKYISGDEVSLTVVTYAGCEFIEWQDGNGNQISTNNPLSFTITQDTTIKPIFKVEKRSFTIANGVTAQMGKLNKNYPWLKTTVKAGLAYMSTNRGQGNTESRDTLIVTPEDGVSYRLTFDYAVSSESGWDKMSIWVNNVIIANGISGATSGSYDSGETPLTGSDTIVMSYSKDYSGNSGDDRGYIYNIVVTSDAPYPVYTRDVTNGSWGTICLPWESIALEGGIYYNVLGTKHAEYGVALVELGESDQLEAGKPYVFKATSEQIKVTYNPTTEVEDEVEGNHIIGSFTGCTVPKDMYIIYQDLLYKSNGANTIGANRAYFDADNMEAYNPATAPARVVFFGGRQAPTELKVRDAQCTMHDGKYLINGQFVIIKDNKMYNAQGIEL